MSTKKKVDEAEDRLVSLTEEAIDAVLNARLDLLEEVLTDTPTTPDTEVEMRLRWMRAVARALLRHAGAAGAVIAALTNDAAGTRELLMEEFEERWRGANEAPVKLTN